MNINEIARRLDIPPNDLKELLPKFGFGVGRRAIKVNDVIANRILKQGRLFQDAWRTKRESARAAEAQVTAALPTAAPIVIPPSISVRDFAMQLNIPVTRLLSELMKNGVVVSLNERIDAETATIVAEDLGVKVTVSEKAGIKEDTTKETALTDALAQSTLADIRPPVVVIMGHVDHGKTRLLDAIRKTNVMEGEAGGITQHIGAYQVERPSTSSGYKQKITFIDTPGHEAFTTMRSRGARVADIAVLVVAADDGVQPQTKEAINIIKGSSLPFVVALNKIDKPEANPERVKKDLAALDVIPEEWGGKTPIVPLSAKEGTGIDQLLEIILLVADIEKEKRKTEVERLAVGTVIESHVDSGAGPIATILVQLGTLHVGDALGVAGMGYGKVRALQDWRGRTVDFAAPGMPVVVIGFKAAPEVGDIIVVLEDAQTLTKMRTKDFSGRKATSATIERSERKRAKGVTLPLIIRADVLGSLETIILSLEKLATPDVGIVVLGKGLGAISEADVLHAESTGALILGFHVLPTATAQELARDKGVSINLYKIIYDLFDMVKAELQKRVPEEDVITELGRLQVLQLFRNENNWSVVGGKVIAGIILPNVKTRIARKGERIGDGLIKEIRVGKEVVTSVQEGQECGLKVMGMTVMQQNDVLEIYKEEKRKRTL